MKRDLEKQCKSIGHYGFLTYHTSDPNYPEITGKVPWAWLPIEGPIPEEMPQAPKKAKKQKTLDLGEKIE